jgi:3D (Asp-Asp-Asp) domain-containing protein
MRSSFGLWDTYKIMKKLILLAFSAILILPYAAAADFVSSADTVTHYSSTISYTGQKSINFIEPTTSTENIIPHPKTYKVWVTAYSSTPEETDDTPFITASNQRVRDGIVAANFLPFGTKVQIPTLFGDKVFLVEDRMKRDHKNFLDVWMPSKHDAILFGISKAEIVVLD